MSHFDHDPGLGHVPGGHVPPEHELTPAAPVSVPMHEDLSAAALGLTGAQHDAIGTPAEAGTLGIPAEYGNPGEYQHYWFYRGNNETCAPASITQVIEAQTGINLHGESLVQHELHELHMPSGELRMDQAQTLLNHFGVPSHLQAYPDKPNAALAQLEQYLRSGKNVVLSVNASPIWYGSETYNNPHADMPYGERADHAVVISAIDLHTGMVTLSDTGNPGGVFYQGGPDNPNGNEEQVPLTVFMDAWHGSNYEMLVTDDRDGGADQHAATEAVMAAGGMPAPEPASQGGGFPAGAAVAAGSVLLAVTLGLRIARSGSKAQPGRGGRRLAGRFVPPGARPATAQ